MQLRALEIFSDVAQRRSFSKAADAHGISQSAVSQAMHHLEDSLGVQLIDRSTRPLSLTASGEVFHQGLQDVLVRIRRLKDEVLAVASGVSGLLHVASIYSVGLSYMPEAQAEFLKRFPDVEVQIGFGRNEAVLEDVISGQAELGLVSFPRSTKELIAVPWQKEPLKLVCAPQHRLAAKSEVTLQDMNGIEMIGFDQSLELRQMIDARLKELGVKVLVRNEFDNADSLVRAIQASNGIGLLPEAAVRRETAHGSLRVVACRELCMTRPLGIVYRRLQRPSQAGYEFASMLLGRPLEPDREKRSSGHRKSLAESDSSSGTSVVA
ncbi:HTH-type transcriptional regulator CysL [Stieleria bergensis]|uniref:HTH-type transcriptional regulator CysL n=1 Tax=Stieleria bergensis TaxID=2528025 RepID=A0A517SSD4_9BACT|nr:MAG: transcriptional regulator [Rhodopirellula sp. TMED11]QDT59040.1 HTH-type transcriptional regulator CysL [Planctomycetes bacterium SV_7m_r]